MMLTPEQLAELREDFYGHNRGLLKSEQQSLFAHIDAQQARIAELEKDAARYRWLRGNLGKTVSHWFCSEGGEQLDENIDNAMQEKK